MGSTPPSPYKTEVKQRAKELISSSLPTSVIPALGNKSCSEFYHPFHSVTTFLCQECHCKRNVLHPTQDKYPHGLPLLISLFVFLVVTQQQQFLDVFHAFSCSQPSSRAISQQIYHQRQRSEKKWGYFQVQPIIFKHGKPFS